VGVYKLDVRLDGDPIPGSPFSFQVEAPAQEQKPKKTVRMHSLFLSSRTIQKPDITAYVDQANRLTLRLRDEKHPRKEGDTVVATISGVEDLPVEVIDNQNGTWTLQYKPQSPGRYDMTVKLNGKEIPGSPFFLQVEEDEESEEDYMEATIDEEFEVSFSLEGKKNKEGFFLFLPLPLTLSGNPLGREDIVIQIEGPEKTSYDLEENEDGTYTLVFVPKTLGDYVLSIDLGDEPLEGSPLAIKVLPPLSDEEESGEEEPEPKQEKPPIPTIVEPPKEEEENVLEDAIGEITEAPEDCVAGEDVIVKVKTKTPQGEEITKGGLSLRGTVVDGASDLDFDVKDCGDGSYHLSFKPVVAGDYKITIKDGERKLVDYKLSVKPGKAGEKSRIVEVDEGTVPRLMERTKAVFTLRLFDEFNNPLKSGAQEIVAKVSGPSEECEVEAKDNSDGTYSLSTELKQGGQYTFNVSCNGKSK